MLYCSTNELYWRSRGGSKTTATSKVAHYNDWNSLTIIKNSSILDVAAVLDLPLRRLQIIQEREIPTEVS